MHVLKNDLDTYYFLNREDLGSNKAKLFIFHNFDTYLASVLGI